MAHFLRFSLLALAGLCFYGSWAGEARATDYTWQGLGSSDEWQNTTGNWNLPLYPGYINQNDTALFTSVTQSYNTFSAGTLTVDSISYIAAGYSLTLNGRFIVPNGITATYANAPDFTVNGLVLLGASTIKSLSGTGALRQFSASGPITVVGPTSSFGGTFAQELALTVGDGTHEASLALTGTYPKENTGTTLVNPNATLVGGAVNALSGLSAHVINGTLSLSGGSNTVDSLSGTGTVSLGSNTLTINNAGTFSGSVTGTGGSIIKASAGTLSLSGSNSYTGGTTVSGGALAVNGSITGVVTVQNGGTLGGSGTVGGAVKVESGGTLSPGNSPGQFTLMSGLTMSSGSMLQMEFNGIPYGLYDHLDVQGAFAAGGTLDLKIGTGYTPAQGDSFTIFNGSTPGYDNGSFTIMTDLGNGLSWDTSALRSAGVVSIVPEPSTWALLVIALLFGVTRRVRWALISDNRCASPHATGNGS